MGHRFTPMTMLDEQGRMIPGAGFAPNRHDVLTGSQMDGTAYPATLITTADHDDRVVPAHSFKYAATLQEKAGNENPALIRIETKSGHGASNVTKQIEATADIYAFIMHNMGITPKGASN